MVAVGRRRGFDALVRWLYIVKNKIKDLDGPGWSRYLETAYKEKEERIIEYALLVVGAGAL